MWLIDIINPRIHGRRFFRYETLSSIGRSNVIENILNGSKTIYEEVEVLIDIERAISGFEKPTFIVLLSRLVVAATRSTPPILHGSPRKCSHGFRSPINFLTTTVLLVATERLLVRVERSPHL